MTTASITATQTTMTGVVGDGLGIETAREIYWIAEVHVHHGGQDDEVTRCQHYLPGLGPGIPAFPHRTAAEAIECGHLVATALGMEVRQ